MFETLRRFLTLRRKDDDLGGKEISQPRLLEEMDSQARASRHLELYEEAMDCLARGETEAAKRLLEEAIELRHDFAEAHVALGRIHHGRGEFEEASDCYTLAIHFRDDLAVAHLQRGLLGLDCGKFSEARGYLERAIALKPDDAVAHNALGAALLKLSQVHAAAASFRRALDLQPDLVQAHSNLGYLLFRELEQFAAGTRHIETALVLAPRDEAVLCNWTMVLQQQGRFDEALALSDRLLAVNPSLHEVRLNRGLVLLTRGDFERGWQDYEARRLLPPFSQDARPWPECAGGSLAGRSVLVYAEQGLGDEIMFASCLPDVIREAGHCVVECSPRLEALFRRSFPAAQVVAAQGQGVVAGGNVPDAQIDCCIAAGSLPRRWRNAPSEFPPHEGYLLANPARVAYWKNRLAGLGGKLSVGISWRGGVQTTRRSLRSIPLDQWLPILRCRGAGFVSLQYSDVRAELGELHREHGITVHHWQEAIDDLDETAALIASLDVVITVQTAVAHLSGALGKNAWVMIATVPEWRYLERGESMPWYPALRLFRQPASGGWPGLIEKVALRLQEYMTSVPDGR